MIYVTQIQSAHRQANGSIDVAYFNKFIWLNHEFHSS